MIETRQTSMKERKKAIYPTSAKIHSRCKIVFLHFFISAMFLSFFGSILNWSEYSQKLFSCCCSFGGFLNHLPNRSRTRLMCWRRSLFVLGQRCFALLTNALVLEMNVLKTGIQTSAPFTHSPLTHTATYVATNDFQTENFLKIANCRYSPSKTGGSYHAQVPISEYATPIRYIHDSVLCWTKWPSSRPSW